MKKLTYHLFLMVVLASIILGGCASSSHIEKADDIHFGRYRTFGWNQMDETHQKHGNSIIDAHIRKAIAEEMEKKGLRMSTNDPDLLLDYSMNVEKESKRESNPIYSTPYNQPFYNPNTRRIGNFYMPSQIMGYDSYNRSVKTGTLTINIYDARQQILIWQGWTQNELYKGNFTSNDVRSNVRSILKKIDERS
jgi:hypothetical protein